LIAKKRSVLKNLHEQLVQHHMEKRYTALVKGTWSKKRHSIDAPLYQNSRCTVVDAKGKEALSHFQPIKNFDGIDASLVEVLIETGRMHQIRVHAQYVEESSETNFIDLTEIKSKFQSDVLVEGPSSRTIGNLITKKIFISIIALLPFTR
jgi:hypothetical protein